MTLTEAPAIPHHFLRMPDPDAPMGTVTRQDDERGGRKPNKAKPLRIVTAFGGNALLRRGEPLEANLQRANIRKAVAAVAAATDGYELVVTHGNGPQVGLLALQAAALSGIEPYPLDVLGAESEGMIGYLLEQEFRNVLPGRDVTTLLTQVVVDPADTAFARPTKPIGPVYPKKEARRLAAAHGWSIAPDGAGFRRVVPSPEPLRILELPTIRLLIDSGVLVVCTGGGGIPVAITDGVLRGVEAVIDKDLAAARLAEDIEADLLLLLTDVPGVLRDLGRPDSLFTNVRPAQLRSLHLPAGSMGPKAEAACRFVEQTGGRAAIGALEDAAALVAGTAGTQIRQIPSLRSGE
jgi:carbamate kinase